MCPFRIWTNLACCGYDTYCNLALSVLPTTDYKGAAVIVAYKEMK